MNNRAKKNTVADTQDFTQGSIFTKLLQFMLPILGALVLQAMYGAVDLLIVGRFGSNAGISGVATGSGILNMATFVVTALASAVTVLSSRYLGAKQNHRIGKLIGSAFAFCLVNSHGCKTYCNCYQRNSKENCFFPYEINALSLFCFAIVFFITKSQTA